jgi:large repetitive protein
VLLVGPAGQKILLMAAAGGGTDIDNLTLTFDDAATAVLPDNAALTAGGFRPSAYGTVFTFPASAPSAPYSTRLADLIGTNPNGTWALFVVDGAASDLGAFQGGWKLTLKLGSTLPTDTVFANTGLITIPSSGASTPYPSTINVSGVFGLITKLTLNLNGVSHTWPEDVDMLLVGPRGQSVLVVSDTGGEFDWVNLNLGFSDDATASLPEKTQVVAGLYKPTNFGPYDSLPAPAPSGPYGSLLNTFVGTDPNGTWSLFIVDDQSIDQGTITSGWSITIATSASQPPPVVVKKETVPIQISLESVSISGNGQPRLVLKGQKGIPFLIEYSTDLRVWAELSGGTMIDDVDALLDTTYPRPSTRFYRVRTLE